ncbi:glycosyltransferase [Lysinibacter cavernae]|uniref:Glycosyltransferase involved in cell wall biosynthesis n=1 Tax=Lysinibacter cavernae TaxID=1640652 RepID=A0A7X5R3P3_9MICO|nr:glycosyltransferase [Lysinibacter cavernae]NIH55094.1 glycosyltransferase involved in cell wall biosynthesis [Lysinibacter cavernae]
MTIDIMMPFYGDPAQFREAVQSVITQSDRDWRLVVINDRFPHWDPAEWLNSLGDDRIQYILNDTNLGINGNFRRSIELMTNEYGTIMGCDDRMLPNYVATVRSLIAAGKSPAYVQPNVRVIDDAGTPVLPLSDRVKKWYKPAVSTPTQLDGEDFARSLLRGNWTYFPAICWNAAELRTFGFQPHLEIVLDLALQLDIVMAGGALMTSDEVAFEYRRHGESASSWTANDGTRFSEEKQFFRDTASTLSSLGWSRAARASRLHVSSRLHALSRLPEAAKAKDPKGFRALLNHAFSR